MHSIVVYNSIYLDSYYSKILLLDMCSNSEDSIWSSGLKKELNKRPRVPKRGPGVAELEKILREQENIGISDIRNVEGFIPHHHYIHVPSAPKFDHLGLTTPSSMISIYANFGHNTLLPTITGSAFVLPEQELFPANLNERFDVNQPDFADSSSGNLSFPAMIQRENDQYPTTMMKQFSGHGNTSSSTPFPIGLHSHVEHPSSQNSHYKSTSRLSEQHKMTSMKLPLPSSLENSLIPPSNSQTSPMFCHFNRPHYQAPTNENQGANFIPFSTPEVPSPPMHLFQGELSKSNVIPYQVTKDRMEHSYQHSESRSDHRPFFNFLDVKEELVKGQLVPNHRGHDASGGIDLRLKL